MDKQVYQQPVLLEVGSFSELTRGSYFGLTLEVAWPPYNKFI